MRKPSRYGRVKTKNRWKARDDRKFNSPKWEDRARQPRRKGQKKPSSDRRTQHDIRKTLGFDARRHDGWLDIMFSDSKTLQRHRHKQRKMA